MIKIDEKLIDQIAELEVTALLEGLKDKELRKNPAFLDKVRKFLKENDMKTTSETKGMTELKKQVTEVIPIFKDMR